MTRYKISTRKRGGGMKFVYVRRKLEGDVLGAVHFVKTKEGEVSLVKDYCDDKEMLAFLCTLSMKEAIFSIIASLMEIPDVEKALKGKDKE